MGERLKPEHGTTLIGEGVLIHIENDDRLFDFELELDDPDEWVWEYQDE